MSGRLPSNAALAFVQCGTTRPNATKREISLPATTVSLAHPLQLLPSQPSFVTMMTRNWIPLLFLSFLCATAQDSDSTTATPSGWGGCINPEDPTASTLVEIGQPTAICLTIGQGGNWADGVPYLRFIFTPKADVYSKFEIPNCKSSQLVHYCIGI
jgi:hypothetical protein